MILVLPKIIIVVVDLGDVGDLVLGVKDRKDAVICVCARWVT
jgi:hypothetical protein